MTPYYQDECVTIYHGDCRAVLPHIQRCDLLVTDPPYGISYATSWRSRNDPLRTGVVNDEDSGMLAAVWPIAVATLKQDRHWYVFASPRRLAATERALGTFKQVLCWDKGDRGTVGDLEAGFGEAWEAIFYGMVGRRILNGPRPRSIIRSDWSGTMDPFHPTVKPVQLLGQLIQWSSLRGEIVVDPFMGSGTMLRAAKDLGRRAIGIEIEERYCEIAAERCRQEVLAL